MKKRLHGEIDEIPRIAKIRRFLLRPHEDRHGDFRQIVKDEIIKIAFKDELARCLLRVTPIPRRAADANGF